MARKSTLQADSISPLMQGILRQAIGAELKKSQKQDKKSGMAFVDLTDLDQPEQKKDEPQTLVKSILNVLDGGGKNNIERLAFEADPSLHNLYSSLYKAKLRLIPDTILKRISIQDDLVAAITNTRSNHMSSFGRPRPDRFSMGFVLEPRDGVLDRCSEEQKKDIWDRIEAMTQKLNTCGETKGWGDNDKMTFAQYLSMSTRDAITVGRIATEVIYVIGPDGKSRPHSFRPIDAGTIYRAAPQKTAAETVRQQARIMLEQLKNKKLIPEKYQNDEYSWVQVIESKPVQAFTSKECLVHNFYPVTHVELDGYPLTPLDTIISAVTTHINIVTHNKLYFQTGRATRGMLVIKSDEMDETIISRIRQQFNASINSVNNAWRMPVFGVGADDEITWSPIDQGQRDAEFQYLSDSNARVILSAYQMSPEELPGYAHLSRGTNNQALSESNNEYKLQAARDVGIKPLIKQWEDFLNANILPILDPILAKIVKIKLLGLDAETAEKESIRLQQDAPVHMTYDEILEKVEKDPVGKEWGGDFPINPQFQLILDNHSGLTAGEIAAHFFGRPELAKRPDLQYVRDPLWFQFQELLLNQQQIQMQAQQPPQPPGGEDGKPTSKTEESDLTRSIDQAIGLLSKSEAQLPASKRRLLAQHRATVDHFINGWEQDVREINDAILKVAKSRLPKTKE
jgi:hypothetical protein